GQDGGVVMVHEADRDAVTPGGRTRREALDVGEDERQRAAASGPQRKEPREPLDADHRVDRRLAHASPSGRETPAAGKREIHAGLLRMLEKGNAMGPAPASLATLSERHRPEIVRYLARLLGDRDEAEDVCQEVFLRAHRAFARLAPDSNCRAWLYR